MWNLLDSTRQGRSHVKQETPCQDKTYCQSYDDVYVITLADGAGSARLSHYGAECVTKCIADELGGNFESYWAETEGRIAKERLFQEISGSLQQIAERHNCQLKDLASTLLAVAVKDERYIILHLGDGVIGYSKEGLLKVASAPNNGEFANTTIFTTSSDACSQMKVFRGLLNGINGFVLMSDGPESCLYDKKSNELANGLLQILEDASGEDLKEVTEGIEEAMDTVITKHTLDDCSLAFMVKRQEKPETEETSSIYTDDKDTDETDTINQNTERTDETEVTDESEDMGETEGTDDKKNSKSRRYLAVIVFVVLLLLLIIAFV